jgi:serine/threonine protein phosphatase 1
MSDINTNTAAASDGEAWSEPPAPAESPSDNAATVADAAAQIAAAEQGVDAFAQQYQQQADGKAGIQKAMDWGRQAFNEGHGDDQFKNIGRTRDALADLRQRVVSGQTSAADAGQELAQIKAGFATEAQRVTAAQADNAELGKAVHGAGRIGVVTLAGLGATAASGGNVFVGFAAAAGAGSVYDAVTVADQGSSAIAPKLDGDSSIGGVAARSLRGEQLNAGDWVRGSFGTLTDGASGAFAGQGMLSGKAAQLGVQQAAAQTGTRASRLALGQAAAQANVVNTAAQTGTTWGLQTLGIAADPTLNAQQKQQQIGQNTLQTAAHLPTQLAFGAASSHIGVGAQLKNKLFDTGAQLAIDGTMNLGQTSVGHAIDGQGFGLSRSDFAAAAVQAVPGTVQNLAQRVPQPHTPHAAAHDQTPSRPSLAAEPHDPSPVPVPKLDSLPSPQTSGTGPGLTTLIQPDNPFELRAQSTDGRTLIVLPDTHGRDDLQQRAFDYLRQEQDWVFGDKTTVVSLGDTIDKGPNSAQNVDALINRSNEDGISDVVTHMGNHELWITEWLNNPDKLKYAHDWIANRGGAIALQSYDRFAREHPEQSSFSLEGIDLANMPVKEVQAAGGRTGTVPDNSNGFYTRLYDRMIEGLPQSHLDFYANLQASTRIGDYFFSHAGADPQRPLDDQGLGALTWIRDPYLNFKGEWQGEPNTIAVSGHTILKQPLIEENKFALDLGTFMTGDFMTVILQNDLVRFGIFRKDAEPVFTDIRGGFDQGLFAPSFDPSLVIKNPKKR